MLKIYGHFFSAPSNKVRLVASALNLEYEYKQLDLTKGEHKTEIYKEINPLGKVPAIEDDGFTLYESDAIIRYLANKQNSPLYPKEAQSRAKIDQWIDFSYNNVLLSVGKILFNTAFAPSMGVEPNLNSIKDGKKDLVKYLPFLEKQLQTTNYICGDSMTLADIAMIASLEPVEFIKYDIGDYKNIIKWRQHIMTQDFYQNIHKHYAAELPARN